MNSEHLFIMYIFDTPVGTIRFRKVDKFSRYLKRLFEAYIRGRIYFSYVNKSSFYRITHVLKTKKKDKEFSLHTLARLQRNNNFSRLFKNTRINNR